MLSLAEKQTLEYYDTHAEAWANSRKKTSEPSFWHSEYQVLKKLLPPQSTILEIGSGSGRESLELTQMGYTYTGIDTSQELLKIAQKTNPSCTFIHTTAYSLPFLPESFDAFTSWAMLPHIPKERIGDALSSIQKSLKSGAIGFIAMREGEGEKQEPETGRWFSYYTQNEFEKILESAGFKIESKSKKPSRANLTWLIFFIRKN